MLINENSTWMWCTVHSWCICHYGPQVMKFVPTPVIRPIFLGPLVTVLTVLRFVAQKHQGLHFFWLLREGNNLFGDKFVFYHDRKKRAHNFNFTQSICFSFFIKLSDVQSLKLLLIILFRMKEKNHGECIPLVLSTSVTFLRESGRNHRLILPDYFVHCFN